MGHFAGVSYFDRRPIPLTDLAGLNNGLAVDRAHDRIRCYPGLAVRGESIVADPAGDGLFAWDGRLDNRESLGGAGLLRPAGLLPPDGVVACDVCRSRGNAGLSDMIGDWSLVSWDARTRTLLLACDYAGVRPLYYCHDRNRVLWSTSLWHLCAWTGASELDPDYVAGYLGAAPLARLSPVKGIRPVPPGCAVRISAEGERVEPYWTPPLLSIIRYQRESDYEEHLLHLFEEAVSSRFRDESPVWAELSGGLDSSSVVCMASRVVSKRTTPATELRTLSYGKENSSDAPFWMEVQRSVAATRTYLDLRDFPAVSERHAGSSAPLLWEARLAEVARRMRAIGSKVLLTGRGGDLIMGNWFDGAEQVSEFFGRGQWKAAIEASARWSHDRKQPLFSVLRSAWENGISGGGRTSETSRMEDSIPAAIRERIQSLREAHEKTAVWSTALPGRRQRTRALMSLLATRSLECPELLHDMNYTHPFFHRPLVEYMLSIPPEIVYGPGEPRRLMRRSFARLLPSKVARRCSKTSYDSSFREALRPLAVKLAGAPRQIRLVELGFVDPDSLQSRLKKFLLGLECNDSQLRQIILLETWLRRRDRGTCNAAIA